MSGSGAVRQVDFHTTKYGPRLLVDAAMLSEMPNFDASTAPYALSFHDILLVTEGTGTFALDDDVHTVRPGVVFFTLPGEVRRFDVSGLDGACLFFAGDFMRETFSDARLIERFAYWRRDRPAASLELTADQQARFLKRFGDMRREFDTLRDDAGHLLRALLYETLVLLGRWYEDAHGPAPEVRPNADVERFLALVERDHASRHRVGDYAREIGVTPGHLNLLCRVHAGRSAGALVRERLALSAKRRLLYGDESAASIAFALGFADPAYFGRFFRRETGVAPQAFRRRHAESGRY